MRKNGFKRLVSAAAIAAVCLTSMPTAVMNFDAYAGAAVGTTLKVSPSHTREKDTTDGYSYEIWQDTTGGNGSMTLGKGGTFNTEWNCQVTRGNFLARRGLDFDEKKATSYGNITMNYAADYSASSQGNSRLCVYGWFKNPLVEYYIIEDWVNWRPTGSSKTVIIDGAEYEIFQNDHTGPTILGTTETFKQYFSVRKQKRTSGTITVSDHFKAWENAGWSIGNLTEVALNVEGWESSGKANVSKLTVEVGGAPVPTTEPTTAKPIEPDSDGFFFKSDFESGKDGWSGRGSASVAVSKDFAASGSSSLYVSDRADYWNGAAINLDSAAFQPGKSYAFSTNVLQDSGSAVDMKFTLQYELGGETHYDGIASATAESGVWTQLQNTSFEIPAGASDMILYVEAPESLTDFYIDDVSGATDGTSITGPKTQKLIIGDVTCDGVVNAFDMAALRKGLTSGEFDSTTAKKAADVDENGSVEIADAIQLESFLLRKITAFTKAEKPTPTIDTSKWDNYKETASSQYIDFYKSSIKHFGNTYRLANKLAAAEKGESLTVAYLGGSITEGKNYTSPFSSYLKDNFAKGSFKEVNAGLSGTSSVVGLVRSEQEVVSQNPDIIFLEFSVNDHEDILYKKCFESCIKKFLSLPNDPAVIILITKAKGGFSSQSQMAPVGVNYDIPTISIDDALTKAVKSGFLKDSDYYTDEYHPHQKGGQLFADCISYYVRQAMKSENQSDSYTIPTKTVYGTEYETCVNMTPSQLQNFNLGSWKQGAGYNSSKSLSYSLTAGSGSPLTFTTSGKGLIVVFKANSSGMGSIDVTVNGKTTKINGNKQYTWGGPDAELGFYDSSAKELNVSISGSNFTIWGLGVVK